jgi:hypothetical protein
MGKSFGLPKGGRLVFWHCGSGELSFSEFRRAFAWLFLEGSGLDERV